MLVCKAVRPTNPKIMVHNLPSEGFRGVLRHVVLQELNVGSSSSFWPESVADANDPSMGAKNSCTQLQ